MEVVGAPLPVLVAELLTDGGVEQVSVQVGGRGWSWLVSGCRLLVWRYHQREPLCGQLALPASDVTHSARLVHLVWTGPGAVPGCVAVSPEGAVRYWPSVLQASVCGEGGCELSGEECRLLVGRGEGGSDLIVATTTCTLLVVSVRGRGAEVRCRRLGGADSLLGGFGRRVSALFWGSGGGSGGEGALVSVRVQGCRLWVLTTRLLQCWQVGGQEGEDSLLGQTDICTAASSSLPEDSLMVKAVDLQLVEEDGEVGCDLVLLLLAEWAGADTRIVVARLHSSTVVSPSRVPPAAGAWRSFRVLQLLSLDPDHLQLIVLPSVGTLAVFVHDRRQIVCTNTDDDGAVQALGLSVPGAQILGSGLGGGLGSSGKVPLFCTSHQGLIAPVGYVEAGVAMSGPSEFADTSVSASVLDITCASAAVDLSCLDQEPPACDLPYLDQERPGSDLSCLDQERPEGDMTPRQSESGVAALLRAASVAFCRHEHGQCSALVQQALTLAEGGLLDAAAVSLSTDILDDCPANDPRWASVSYGDGVVPQSRDSSGSVIITNQLEDKRCAHQLFVGFLCQCTVSGGGSLWQQLSASPGGPQLVLARHHELLVLAVTLASLSASLSRLLDSCIQRLIDSRPAPSPPLPPSLTPRDRFFRRVSRVEDVFPALLREQGGDGGSELAVTRVLTTVVKAMWHCTEQTSYPPVPPTEDSTSHCLAASELVLQTLQSQHSTLVRLAGDGQRDTLLLSSVFQHLTELSDLLLSGLRLTLPVEEFQERRHALLLPLLEACQFERAAELAEKFEDFGILVELCERTDDSARRQRYLAQFGSRGFAGFLFHWLVERGACGRLLGECETPVLAAHLDQHLSLRWLNEIQQSSFRRAADTLSQCAEAESELLSRKKTYLSLAKLCLLADQPPSCPGEDDGQRLEDELALLELQQQLPSSVLEASGLDPLRQPVLSPHHTALLLTSDDNRQADELQFVRALELAARSSDQPEQEPSVTLQVWRRALLRDLQHERLLLQQLDHPMQACQNMLFFRVAEAARTTALSLADPPPPHLQLPPLQLLLDCQQLNAASENPSIRFLLQAGYEQIVSEC